MKEKIRLVFLPYVFILVGLTIICSFLRWLFISKLQRIEIDEEITALVIPLVLAAIAVAVFIWPRLKMLKFKEGRNSRVMYCMVAFGFVSLSLDISGICVEAATGTFTHLGSINEINQVPRTQYYSLDSYYVYKDRASTYTVFTEQGRYKGGYNMSLYIAMPIFRSIDDTVSSQPLGWLGVQYGQTIINWLDQSHKDLRYEAFAARSLGYFQNRQFQGIEYLRRLDKSDTRDGYLQAVRNNTVYKPNETIFLAFYEPFEERNAESIQDLITFSLAGTLVWLVMVMATPLREQHQVHPRFPPSTPMP